jgi:2-haloacid dehalogenase
MFGTVLDWRTGVARSVEATLKPRGYDLDWFAFADAWRAQYDQGIEEVRSGRIPYTKLDVLHRRMLDLFLSRFRVKDLPEDVMHDLTLSWHRLDGGQTWRPQCLVWAKSFFWHPALMAISR